MATTKEQPIFIDTTQLNSAPSSFPDSSRGNTTWHTLFSNPNAASNALSSGVAVCPSAGSLALHRHNEAEIYYILSGIGEIEVNGKRREVTKGMVIWIPGNAEHGVFCREGEELKWLYVFPEGCFDRIMYRFTHECKVNQRPIISKI